MPIRTIETRDWIPHMFADVWCYAGETRRPPAIGLNAAILSLEPEEKVGW